MFSSLKNKRIRKRKFDEEVYAQALKEFESGEIRKGLMAKAIANGDGETNKTNAIYIRLLAEAIRDDRHIARSNSDRPEGSIHPPRQPQGPKSTDRSQLGPAEWLGLFAIIFGVPALIIFIGALLS